MKKQGFSPTPGMEFFAYTRAKIGDDAFNAEVARQSGIREETVSRWKQVPGFEEWLSHRVAYYRTDIHTLLEQIALKSLGDFRFWESMAKKYGFIEVKPDQQAPAAPGIQMTSDQMLELVEKVRAKKAQ